MKTAEQKRKDPCFGQLSCWNHIQRKCPVYLECFAKSGGRKVDKIQHKTSNMQFFN